MKKETTKKTTSKERIVVLEKGKGIDIGPMSICCDVFIMPYRAG